MHLSVPVEPYDPGTVLPGIPQLFQIRASGVATNGQPCARVRLTALGNQALREVCHYAHQREKWMVKPYEFWIYTDGGQPRLTANLVRSPHLFPCIMLTILQLAEGNDEVTNSLLVASRGHQIQIKTCSHQFARDAIFASTVRYPLAHLGGCANCIFLGNHRVCDLAGSHEPPYDRRVEAVAAAANRLALDILTDH